MVLKSERETQSQCEKNYYGKLPTNDLKSYHKQAMGNLSLRRVHSVRVSVSVPSTDSVSNGMKQLH